MSNEEQKGLCYEWQRPIPFGELRVLLAILILPAACSLGRLWYDKAQALHYVSATQALIIIGAVMAALGGFGFLGLLDLRPVAFLKDYFDRNVRGYVAYFYVCDQGEFKDQLHWEVKHRGEWMEKDKARANIFCAIPLGGRFTKPRMQRFDSPMLQWKIVRARLGVPPAVTILLQDLSGNRIDLPVEQALWLAESHDSGFYNVVDFYRRAVDSVRYQHQEIAPLRRLIAEAIRRIGDSQRFVKSEQGAEIREWLDQSLRTLWPEYREQKEQEEGRLSGAGHMRK